MKSFKEFLEEKDDVWSDIGYGLSKDDIENAKKLAASLSSKPVKPVIPDNIKKEIKNAKANLRRWYAQYNTLMIPRKRKELNNKINDALEFIKKHEK